MSTLSLISTCLEIQKENKFAKEIVFIQSSNDIYNILDPNTRDNFYLKSSEGDGILIETPNFIRFDSIRIHPADDAINIEYIIKSEINGELVELCSFNCAKKEDNCLYNMMEKSLDLPNFKTDKIIITYKKIITEMQNFGLKYIELLYKDPRDNQIHSIFADNIKKVRKPHYLPVLVSRYNGIDDKYTNPDSSYNFSTNIEPEGKIPFFMIHFCRAHVCMSGGFKLTQCPGEMLDDYQINLYEYDKNKIMRKFGSGNLIMLSMRSPNSCNKNRLVFQKLEIIGNFSAIEKEPEKIEPLPALYGLRYPSSNSKRLCRQNTKKSKLMNLSTGNKKNFQDKSVSLKNSGLLNMSSACKNMKEKNSTNDKTNMKEKSSELLLNELKISNKQYKAAQYDHNKKVKGNLNIHNLLIDQEKDEPPITECKSHNINEISTINTKTSIINDLDSIHDKQEELQEMNTNENIEMDDVQKPHEEIEKKMNIANNNSDITDIHEQVDEFGEDKLVKRIKELESQNCSSDAEDRSKYIIELERKIQELKLKGQNSNELFTELNNLYQEEINRKEEEKNKLQNILDGILENLILLNQNEGTDENLLRRISELERQRDEQFKAIENCMKNIEELAKKKNEIVIDIYQPPDDNQNNDPCDDDFEIIYTFFDESDNQEILMNNVEAMKRDANIPYDDFVDDQMWSDNINEERTERDLNEANDQLENKIEIKDDFDEIDIIKKEIVSDIEETDSINDNDDDQKDNYYVIEVDSCVDIDGEEVKQYDHEIEIIEEVDDTMDIDKPNKASENNIIDSDFEEFDNFYDEKNNVESTKKTAVNNESKSKDIENVMMIQSNADDNIVFDSDFEEFDNLYDDRNKYNELSKNGTKSVKNNTEIHDFVMNTDDTEDISDNEAEVVVIRNNNSEKMDSNKVGIEQNKNEDNKKNKDRKETSTEINEVHENIEINAKNHLTSDIKKQEESNDMSEKTNKDQSTKSKENIQQENKNADSQEGKIKQEKRKNKKNCRVTDDKNENIIDKNDKSKPEDNERADIAETGKKNEKEEIEIKKKTIENVIEPNHEEINSYNDKNEANNQDTEIKKNEEKAKESHKDKTKEGNKKEKEDILIVDQKPDQRKEKVEKPTNEKEEEHEEAKKSKVQLTDVIIEKSEVKSKEIKSKKNTKENDDKKEIKEESTINNKEFNQKKENQDPNPKDSSRETGKNDKEKKDHDKKKKEKAIKERKQKEIKENNVNEDNVLKNEKDSNAAPLNTQEEAEKNKQGTKDHDQKVREVNNIENQDNEQNDIKKEGKQDKEQKVNNEEKMKIGKNQDEEQKDMKEKKPKRKKERKQEKGQNETKINETLVIEIFNNDQFHESGMKRDDVEDLMKKMLDAQRREMEKKMKREKKKRKKLESKFNDMFMRMESMDSKMEDAINVKINNYITKVNEEHNNFEYNQNDITITKINEEHHHNGNNTEEHAYNKNDIKNNRANEEHNQNSNNSKYNHVSNNVSQNYSSPKESNVNQKEKAEMKQIIINIENKYEQKINEVKNEYDAKIKKIQKDYSVKINTMKNEHITMINNVKKENNNQSAKYSNNNNERLSKHDGQIEELINRLNKVEKDIEDLKKKAKEHDKYYSISVKNKTENHDTAILELKNHVEKHIHENIILFENNLYERNKAKQEAYDAKIKKQKCKIKNLEKWRDDWGFNNFSNWRAWMDERYVLKSVYDIHCNQSAKKFKIILSFLRNTFPDQTIKFDLFNRIKRSEFKYSNGSEDIVEVGKKKYHCKKFKINMKKKEDARKVLRKSTCVTHNYIESIDMFCDDRKELYIFSETNSEIKLAESVNGMTCLRMPDAIKNLGKRKKLEMIYKIFKAMVYLHDSSIVIGNMNHLNISITQNMDPKFIHWGYEPFSIDFEQQNIDYLNFMPPEYRNGAIYDESGDVYGAGLLMNYILTDEVPKENLDRLALNLDDKIRNFVLQCIKEDSRERINSVDLMRSIERMLM